jgi:hypothetical protein
MRRLWFVTSGMVNSQVVVGIILQIWRVAVGVGVGVCVCVLSINS